MATTSAGEKVYAGLTTSDGTGYVVTHFHWMRKYPSLVRCVNGNEYKIVANFRSFEEAYAFRDWMIALRPDAVDAE